MHRLLSLSLVLAACGPLPGDRAGGGGTGGGGCPAFEECSPQTPDGLFFEGQLLAGGLFDVGDHPTAVGGEQIYELFINDNRDPLRKAFVAEVDEDDIDVAEIVSSGGSTVTLRALAAGAFSLRILDTNGALMDRITLDSSDIAEVAAGPTLLDVLADPEGTTDLDNPPLYLEGGAATVVVQLSSTTGARLVDNELFAEGAGGGSAWDFIELDPITGALVVSAGGEQQAIPIITTTSIDDVVRAFDPETPTIELSANSSQQLCFRAQDGVSAVLGAEWSYAVTADQLSLRDNVAPNCVTVDTGAPEVGSLTAAAEQTTATYDLIVSSAAVARPAHTDRGTRSRSRPLAGDRAGQL